MRRSRTAPGLRGTFRDSPAVRCICGCPVRAVCFPRKRGGFQAAPAGLECALSGSICTCRAHCILQPCLPQYRAVLANYESVNIIHGYGQGVIRNRVQELLKHNPNVKSFRYGGEGEGLNGATVVFLK